MLNTLHYFFNQFTSSSPAQSTTSHEHSLHLASAVLLAEVMRADPEIGEPERNAAMAALSRRFTLTPDELAALVDQARAEASRSNDFFYFTNRINDHFSQPEKIALVEAMWEVAYADGILDANEHHVISKVAGLLHVTHGEYIAAKLHAKQAAGLDS
jgi:uncharacterized tellurite resistance protein B-like protein